MKELKKWHDGKELWPDDGRKVFVQSGNDFLLAHVKDEDIILDCYIFTDSNARKMGFDVDRWRYITDEEHEMLRHLMND
jgi:hypothetical protein